MGYAPILFIGFEFEEKVLLSVAENNFDMLDSAKDGLLLKDTIRCPELTSGAKEIRKLAEDLPKNLAVFAYKQQMPCLWVVFVGGTGTGKSTLFNAFSGSHVSEMGVERPKTLGPVVYAHQDCPIEKGFPFPAIQIERRASEGSIAGPTNGVPGHLLILEHDRQDLSHLLVVDTPDLDSVEPENREIAEDLYLLSDVVVFVTSQEKYADEVPYQFLLRILQDRTPYFFLLNKAGEQLTKEEVLGAIRTQGITFGEDRVRLIPYTESHPLEGISGNTAFRDFLRLFSRELSGEGIENLRAAQYSRRTQGLKTQIERLVDLLEEENRAAQNWLKELQIVSQEISRDLIQEHAKRFTAESREYVRAEISRLLSKYDVLAKPRQFVRELLWGSLGLLGIGKKTLQKTHKDALLRLRQRIDLTPVQVVIEKLNRVVLQRLSPPDESSPLFQRLRQTGVALSDEEIRERIWQEQDQLAEWLEQTFQKLSRGIPKHKAWGIFSTSILWGILIISLEIAVGGGFTVLDAVLDTAIAPFLTKGATELFAYHEVQKVVRELAKRYQDGLLSIVRHQRERYEHCLEPIMTPGETMESLKALRFEIGNSHYDVLPQTGDDQIHPRYSP